MLSLNTISTIATVIGVVIGMPTAFGAYYQAWKARQEARQARNGLIFSANCLEFVLEDGTPVNLVTLESLHTLPKPGDVVLLPAGGIDDTSAAPGAFHVDRIEHIYSRVEGKDSRPKQARLVKAVAHVNPLYS
jgi:hypothetical protein